VSPDDQKYQWGKMSRRQPYIMLATDILRAIAGLGLRDIEGQLLFYVIENTWGKTAKRGRAGEPWPDTKPCSLEISRLVRILKLPKQRIHEAKTRLLKSLIIVEVEGGFIVNKEAHLWVKPDTNESRLSPEYLAYAASAQKLNAPEASTVSANPVTPYRDASTSAVTLQRDSEDLYVTVYRDISTSAVTPYRDAQNEEAHAGKPYGVNTNPTGSQSKARETRIAAPKQRGLALSDDEPFISPPDTLPLPVPAPDDPETTALLATLWPIVLKATTSVDYPDGNGDVAEFVAKQARMWRQQNYPGEIIKGYIEGAFRNGVRSSLSLSRYVVKCLNTYADEQAKLRTAPPKVLPSQTRPMTYHRATPGPVNPEPIPEGF
jgi:hypothetical protein